MLVVKMATTPSFLAFFQSGFLFVETLVYGTQVYTLHNSPLSWLPTALFLSPWTGASETFGPVPAPCANAAVATPTVARTAQRTETRISLPLGNERRRTSPGRGRGLPVSGAKSDPARAEGASNLPPDEVPRGVQVW